MLLADVWDSGGGESGRAKPEPMLICLIYLLISFDLMAYLKGSGGILGCPRVENHCFRVKAFATSFAFAFPPHHLPPTHNGPVTLCYPFIASLFLHGTTSLPDWVLTIPKRPSMTYSPILSCRTKKLATQRGQVTAGIPHHTYRIASVYSTPLQGQRCGLNPRQAKNGISSRSHILSCTQ